MAKNKVVVIGKKQKAKAPAKAQKAAVVAPQSNKYMTAVSSKSSSAVGILGKYLCAVNDPFCLAAEGARIPDEYALPTEAVTCRLKFVWTPVFAGAETLVLVPDPRVSALLFAGAGTATPSIVSAGAGITGNITAGAVAGRINTINYGAAVSASALEVRCTKYRVVGWGVRIRNVSPAANVAGDLTVALTPCGSYLPATLASPCGVVNCAEPFPSVASGGWNEPQEAFGIPYSGTNPAAVNNNSPIVSSLETLPVSEVLSAAELAQTGGICVKPRISSAEAFSWRSPSAVGQTFGLGYAKAGAQGGAVDGGYGFITPSALFIGGHNAVAIQATGSGTQTYELELVYHLECQPNTISGAGGLGHSASASPVVSRASVDSVLARANASPFLDFVKHEGSRAIGSMAMALPGLITKAAIMSLA